MSKTLSARPMSRRILPSLSFNVGGGSTEGVPFPAHFDMPSFLTCLIRPSFFASIYALAHTNRIWQSNHSAVRKVFLTFEAVYNAITLLFSWFAVVSAPD